MRSGSRSSSREFPRLETSLGSIPTNARAQRVKTWHETTEEYPEEPAPGVDVPYQLPFVFLNERFDDTVIGVAVVDEVPDSLIHQGVGYSPGGWRSINSNMFAFRVGPRWILSDSSDSDCEGLQGLFDIEFNGFAPEQNSFDVIGFNYDDDAEETVCVKTDICSLMYSFVEPVAYGTREPDGEQDDYLLGYFGDDCTVMNLCERLQKFDTEPPESYDTPRLFWSSNEDDSPCRWAYICDVMAREFTFDPFGTPGSGAEYLYIENEVCFRSRITPGSVTCNTIIGLFEGDDFNGTVPSVVDNPIKLMGYWDDPALGEVCVNTDVCMALYSIVAEYALGDTPQDC